MDSNHVPLESEATAIPIEPQSLTNRQSFVEEWKWVIS